jgi:hypothetical protein
MTPFAECSPGNFTNPEGTASNLHIRWKLSASREIAKSLCLRFPAWQGFISTTLAEYP